MKYYNLYHKDSKLNNKPISEDEKNEIIKQHEIYKKCMFNNKLERIKTKDIKFVKTIII
jgi:hypothetical protein